MTEPRILLYDIETTPSLVYTWSHWNTNVIATAKDWEILSFAWKWLGTKKVSFASTQGAKNDKHVVKMLWQLLDEADIVIAHNGDKFDQKKANTRFMKWGLGPPSPYQSIDTLKEVRRSLSHYSNSLNELGRYHELGHKIEHTGVQLWLDCMAGDPKAWKLMEKYNRQDVLLLEKVYLTLRPFIGIPGRAAHPNLGLWKPGELVCTKCASSDVVKRGFHRTLVSLYQTIYCKNCTGYSRIRVREPQEKGKAVQAV
jgi:uncharacterized protein YprB with RNaseH-like and TPR domain